ncbi:hypothetical protein D3C72_2116340 [compost metagenome]
MAGVAPLCAVRRVDTRWTVVASFCTFQPLSYDSFSVIWPRLLPHWPACTAGTPLIRPFSRSMPGWPRNWDVALVSGNSRCWWPVISASMPGTWLR